ncbi:MAG TPA: nickel insertion protein, partial [Terriglobales bacterium]|nr:nickel insertion protein [Terriglobales bacterium]
MKIAYLDCFSGMSGDMFLGALVDAGVPASLLEKTVAALNVGARLEISRVVRSGISATKVDVWVDGEKDLPREEYWERQEQQAHSHKHSDHEHEHHGHTHSHSGETRTGVSAPHEH